jgi:hypothetical protein
VVGSAEGAERRAGRARGPTTCAGDPQDLDGLAFRERRQDRRDPPRRHRLARAGRPDEQQVVSAGRRDLQRAPQDRLSSQVAQIGELRPIRREEHRLGRRRLLLPSDQLELAQVRDGNDSRSTRQRGLGRVLGRHGEGPGSDSLRCLRHREGARDRANRSVERELARQRQALELLGGELLRGAEQRRRYSEVEAGAALPQVGGRKARGDPLLGKLELRVLECGPHPLARLPNRGVGKSHQGKGGEPAPHIDLDLNWPGLDAEQGEGLGGREHGRDRRCVRLPRCS